MKKDENFIMKILFLGLGGIGQRHLRNIRQIYGENIEIIAYRKRGLTMTVAPDLKIDKNVDFTEKYSVKVYDDLNDALNQSPTIAFICNPSSFHIQSSIAAAQAGCDLFIEKPLSNSIDQIDELVKVCKENKIITFVGFQLRFHPCYKILKNRQQLLQLPKEQES